MILVLAPDELHVGLVHVLCHASSEIAEFMDIFHGEVGTFACLSVSAMLT